MIMGTIDIRRTTGETDVTIMLGDCPTEIDTGCGFLNHMLTLFAFHGRFALSVKCAGDVDVDYHHTVEDIGIALGQAFDKMLGDRRGIVRYGSFAMPMDETLVLCAIDISGRDFLNFDVQIPCQKVGDFDTELVSEFFAGFSRSIKASLHFKQLAGTNSHHIIEACFKAFGQSMRQAVSMDAMRTDTIPSTKGAL